MSTAKTARRPRADALRNRERIVQAAIEAFRDQGLDVSVADIARRAGVGSGTLFRNYASKEELIEAIVELQVQRLADLAASFAEAEDPTAAFAEFFTAAVRFHFEDRGMLDAAACGIFDRPKMATCRKRAVGLTEAILEHARSAGAIGDDLTAEDFHALASGTAQSVRVAARDDSAIAEQLLSRYVAIVLAGLRP